MVDMDVATSFPATLAFLTKPDKHIVTEFPPFPSLIEEFAHSDLIDRGWLKLGFWLWLAFLGYGITNLGSLLVDQIPDDRTAHCQFF